MAAVTLSSWCVPVGLAGGLSTALVMVIWMIWSGVFAIATCAVHVVIAATAKRPSRPVWALGAALILVVMATLGWVVPDVHLPRATLAIPVSAIALFLGLTLGPIHAKRLRPIGWSVVGVSLLTLVLMVIALR
ncbi:MAG: hypothetical protein HQ485_06510 [Acidobacteria bacterium]|jgi:hypothetical protein|nr:hypothetical protein [Acidobacteriota bacterium]